MLPESAHLIVSIVLFVLTYALMLIFQKYRPWIAISSAILFVVLGILPISDVIGAVDFNVLLMIAGTMGTVALMIESKMPALMADVIIEKVPNVKWAIIFLSLFAGIVSAFIDNVATVLMIAPIALAISKRLNTSPVGMIIAIAVSSNLQGAATLVGDTTSILLGGHLGMNFLDFFVYQGKPGLFWYVELGALCSLVIVYFLFRKYKDKILPGERTKVTDYVPSILMLSTVLLLIVVSIIPGEKHPLTNGLICVAIMIVGLVYRQIRRRDFKSVIEPLKEIDFNTILMLLGLFIVVAGISHAGVIDLVAQLFVTIGGDNLFVIYTLVVWLSVVFSAFIDNIPYVTTMLPVMSVLGAQFSNPVVLCFGLLTGATLGGNLTPIGASANITGIGILRKEGYEVKNKDFLKIGVPFTLSAIIPAYVLIWVFFGI